MFWSKQDLNEWWTIWREAWWSDPLLIDGGLLKCGQSYSKLVRNVDDCGQINKNNYLR